MKRFVICTSVGAIGKADGSKGDPNSSRGLSEERAEWLNESVSDGASLEEVVQQFKPTCLLGLAAQPAGLFTEAMVRGMVEYTDHPIVMPMSNPTCACEREPPTNPAAHRHASPLTGQRCVCVARLRGRAKAECTPEQAYTWTDGKAIVSTGSPFPDHKLPSGKVLIPSQCNNLYCFPGIGLGASVSGVKEITDRTRTSKG